MTLDLKKPFLDLEDKPVQDVLLSRILANAIASSDSGNVIKMGDWASKLYKTGQIEIDLADKILLNGWVENCKALNLWMRRQIMGEIEALKA